MGHEVEIKKHKTSAELNKTPLRHVKTDLTSTKASVRSLARSMTGRCRPAMIFAFSLPGMVQIQTSLNEQNTNVF